MPSKLVPGFRSEILLISLWGGDQGAARWQLWQRWGGFLAPPPWGWAAPGLVLPVVVTLRAVSP